MLKRNLAHTDLGQKPSNKRAHTHHSLMADSDPTYRLTSDGKVYRRGTKRYANLDVYEGEFLDNMRHGEGMLRMFSGDLYVGEHERNMFHGVGTYTYTPFTNEEGQYIVGKKYEGQWQNGKFHGKGIFVLGTGGVYSGVFERGLYHGQGHFKSERGDTYVGIFHNGKAGGKMRIDFVNGDVYDGELKAGAFHGKGKFVYSQGRGMYEGEWARGRSHGHGMRIYSNGSRYVGSFQDGEPHGEGVMFYANGDQFIGQMVRGSLCGRGVIKYARGDSYEGNFLNGVCFGEGKFSWSDGSYYEGQYRCTKVNKITEIEMPVANGKRHGFGLRVFANGARYKGSWNNDKMDGPGELVQVDGAKFEGVFSNGLKHGYGQETFGNLLSISYICPAGHRHKGIGYCKYDGTYFRGFLQGKGVYCCLDGREYRGDFSNGKRHGYGRQEYLREGDRGDLARQCVGGRGSMYRIALYEGHWHEGERHGAGKITYVNGDTVSGHFVNGILHGFAEYEFNAGLPPSNAKRRRRMVHYIRGERREWLDKSAKAVKEASSFLIRLRGQIKQEEEMYQIEDKDSRAVSRASRSR